MYIQQICPCCNNIPEYLPAQLSQFVVWRITGINPNKNIEVNLAHCVQCDYYYSTTRFDDKETNRLYTGYRDSMYNQMRQQCEPTYNPELYTDVYITARKKFIKSFIQPHILKIKSILDFGGDDGSYMPDVSEKYVYDLSGKSVLPGIIKYNLENNMTFDLVMNCQVLEHVSDVNQFIIDLKAKTKKYLYIEVPAYRDPPAVNMVIGEHINFFREQSLHALLNKHEINIVDTAVDYDLKVLGVLGKI